MRYRDFADRKVSAYVAILIVTLFASLATFFIERAIARTVISVETEDRVLRTIDTF
jgi:hypothetical protein